MLEYKEDTKIYKISYLLLADTIERLDMILLELRHLQKNIIYSMREPGFNAPLRFEEDFLWGNDWDHFFQKYTVEDEDAVIDENILHFPTPDSLVEFNEGFRKKASYLVHQKPHLDDDYDIKKIKENALGTLDVFLSEIQRSNKFFGFNPQDLNDIDKIISGIRSNDTAKQKEAQCEFNRIIPILLRQNLNNIAFILDQLKPDKASILGFSKEIIPNIEKKITEFLKIIPEGKNFDNLKEEARRTGRDIFKEVRPILIQVNLNNLVYHLWNKTEWRISYKRHYANLRGTQLLKKIIVRDKFKLCRFALTRAGIVAGKKDKPNMDKGALARFIILRSAIHARCNQYLERIMEYQSLFSKVLDIGVKEFPMPSTDRRREIGIYMDFLDDRVYRIHEETVDLIERLGISTPQEDKKDKKQKKSEEDFIHEKPIILHSWKHHFTAEHQVQEDAIGRSPHTTKTPCDLHHITTSYWMPERMDLQPIIGHETAHLVLQQHFDNLSDIFLQHSNADFVDLQRSLLRVLNHYHRILEIGKLSPVHKPHALLREISCDFLAASVKGFSYLYALLLESIGIDLYKHLLYGNFESEIENANLVDLDMIYSLKGTGGHPMTMRRDWWLRLKLVIFWLKRIHHWQPSGLDIILLEGTDSLLDNLLVFFDRITLQRDDRKGELWNALFERLCDEIEISPAVKQVRKWRADRSCATEKTLQEQQDNRFQPSTPRFPDNIRNALKEIQIGLKIKKGKALAEFLNNEPGEKKGEFDKAYLIDEPFSYKDEIIFSAYSGHRGYQDNNSWEGANLHGYLYDIPWTCAMTRTIDLFGYDESILQKITQEKEHELNRYNDAENWLDWYKDAPEKKTLEVLTEDNAQGRELYSLALEFHIVNAEDPLDRLVHVRHLLRTHDALRKIIQKEGYNNVLFDIIKETKGNEGSNEIKNIDNTLDAIREIIEEACSKEDKKTINIIKKRIKQEINPNEDKQLLIKYFFFWIPWKQNINKILDEENRTEANNSMRDALEFIELIRNKIAAKIKNNNGTIKNIEDHKNYKMFLSVINYLKFYEKDNNNSITGEIINAITSLHKVKNECYLHQIFENDTRRKDDKIRCFRMILVNRYAIGGYYAMQSKSEYDAFTDRRKLTPVQMLKGDTYWSTENKKNNKEENGNNDCKIYPLHKTQYCNVLGRYDALSFTRTRPLCRCTLPYFDKSSPYQFTSLLTRREFGIRIDLDWNKGEKCKEHINRESEEGLGLVGAVSVILKRRALRMPFLARLLASVQENENEINGISPEKQLTGDKLDKKKDLILLLDGSVDFLILLCEKYGQDDDSKDKQVLCRISDVLDSAYWLFQDFMVERTEIIFDAIVLDYVANEIITTKESKFSIECKIRFFEDQFLDYSLEDFRDGLFARINATVKTDETVKTDDETKQTDPFFMVMAEITPGRMDMTLRLFPPDFININEVQNDSINRGKWYLNTSEDKTFRDQLIALLEPNVEAKDGKATIAPPPCIDRVEITVTKRPPQFGEEKEERCQ